MGTGTWPILYAVLPDADVLQLAYFEQVGTVQAVSGSSDMLLFPCDKFITSFDFDAGHFRWTQRSRRIAEMEKLVNSNDISEDTFIDACLLSGTHFLPALPSLDAPPRNKMPKPLSAMEMIYNSNARTGISVVLGTADDPRIKEMRYADNFRKARLAVKHQPILTKAGKIEPVAENLLPNDAHEFIGQRLPDEIYYYMSRGLISPHILNWRATSEIIEPPPMDGGDSEVYQTLVSSKLTPLRTTAINLLSSSLHNWYQHKDLTLKCWFPDSVGKPHTSTISMRGLPDSRRTVEMWNVKVATLREVATQYKVCRLLFDLGQC